jgi:hypothetical protein
LKSRIEILLRKIDASAKPVHLRDPRSLLNCLIDITERFGQFGVLEICDGSVKVLFR